MSNLNDNINIIDENGEVKSLPRAVIEANKIDYISIDEDKFIAMANKLRTANLIYLPEVTEDDKIGISTMSKSLGLQSYDDEREFSALVSQDFITTGKTLAILNPEVTTIGALMFRDSSYVEHLVLPFIKRIDSGAFLYISGSNLKTIYAPRCETFSSSALKPGQYDENNTITSINLDSITEIPTALFSNHTKLSNISFYSTLTIGEAAFMQCRALTSVYFPNATDIATVAFEQCALLKKIDFPKVKNIGTYAFSYCENLEEINLPEVLNIMSDAFFNLKKLPPTINLPKVEIIDSQAFMQTNIVNINTPILKTIEYESFAHNPSLQKIYAPLVTSIGEDAFENCSSLSDVNMLSTETITQYAFSGCTSLRRIEFNNIKTIGQAAFAGCKDLVLIIRTPTICTIIIDSYSFSSTVKIYVPDTLLEQYKTKYTSISTQFYPLSELPA